MSTLFVAGRQRPKILEPIDVALHHVATYTITFAAFQSLGPLLTGALADSGAGGLRLGLGLSALVLLIGAGLAASQRRVEPVEAFT